MEIILNLISIKHLVNGFLITYQYSINEFNEYARNLSRAIIAH